MTRRTEQKARSHGAIVAAAAGRIRLHGIRDMGVADVMADAGLTHGGFYAHFKNKDALVTEAIGAGADFYQTWLAQAAGVAEAERLSTMAQAYLTREHRDKPQDGCFFATVGHEVASGSPEHRRALEKLLVSTAESMGATLRTGMEQGGVDRAFAAISLCVGAMTLARAVESVPLSERLLRAAKVFLSEADSNVHQLKEREERKKLKKLKKKSRKNSDDASGGKPV